jgi:hypothetical protein
LDGNCFNPPTINTATWNPSVLDESAGFKPVLTVDIFNRIAWNHGTNVNTPKFGAEGMLMQDDQPLQTNAPITFQLKW